MLILYYLKCVVLKLHYVIMNVQNMILFSPWFFVHFWIFVPEIIDTDKNLYFIWAD